jgi:putative MATE family efflux protein
VSAESTPRSGLLRRSPHDREIARLAVPAFGALIAEPLYVLADTAVVGHIGTTELAGLAVATSVLLTGYAAFIFLAYGTTAAVSRLLGAGRKEDAAHQAVQGLWLATLIGVAVATVVYLATDPLLGAMGASGEVLSQARIYLQISLLGVPAQLLVFAGTGYLRGLQDTVTPLVVAIATAVGNLVLELVLIGVFDKGIGASALTTVAAQWAAAAVYVTLILRATRRLGATTRPDWAAIAQLARTGGDLLLRTLALRGALTGLTAVATRVGTAEVGAHEVAFAIWSLLALALDAVAIAGQSLIGRSLGAGDVATAKQQGRRMLELGIAAGVIAAVVILSVRPWLPHVFSQDPSVVHLTGFLLLWAAVLQPVNGAVFVLDGLLIGAGDMRFLAWAMALAALVTVVPAGAVVVFDLGIGWVWFAVASLMVSRAIVLGARWRSGRWAVVGATR